MPEAATPTLTLSRTFDDFDELADLARAWRIDFRQLDRGAFRGKLEQVIQGNVQLARARFGRRIDQRGAPPAGLRTFAIPADPALRLFWRGRWVSGSQILAFPPGGELEAISPPGFDMLVYSISDAQLEEAGRTLDIPRSVFLPDGVEVISCAPRSMQLLRRRMASACRRLTTGALRAGAACACALLEVDVPRQLAMTLASGRADCNAAPSRIRDASLREALAYISKHGRIPLTVCELCDITGASERTLQYAFTERFGISPKAYLRAWRLNGVHRELRRSDPAVARVADIARQWGFEHLSQFATDYRKLFGHKPSDTLNAPPREPDQPPSWPPGR